MDIEKEVVLDQALCYKKPLLDVVQQEKGWEERRSSEIHYRLGNAHHLNSWLISL